MNFIKTFTKKNIARNKKRTIVTIIGVMLSAALICTVAGMAASFMESLRQSEIKTVGNFHAQFTDVPADKLSLITENVHVKDYSITRGTKLGLNTESTRKSMPFVRLVEFDTAANDMLAVKLSAGRLPEKEGEIVIPEQLNSMCGNNLTIGDTITIPLGKRVWMDEEIPDWLPVVTKENAEAVASYIEDANPELYQKYMEHPEEESFVIEGEKTYTVTGVMQEMCSYARSYDNCSFPGIVWVDDAEFFESTDLVSVYVRFDNVKKAGDYCDEIQALFEDGDGICYTKTDLARFNGGVGDDASRVLRRIVAVIVGVIVLTSVFVITNSFRISVSEKEGQYGMLASIGATKKQIKRTVFAEGAYIGIIGTVSGILLGIGVMFILVAVVNYLLMDMLELELVFAFPWWVAAVTALMSAVTIYFSCMLPARAAAKISPIEAIRGNRDYNRKLSGKKLKTSRLTKKLFGTGGVIASKNLKRSRRKYRTTVVSLVLGVATFVGLSSFIGLGETAVHTQYTTVDYDIMVNTMYDVASVDNGAEKTAAAWESMRKLPHVDRLYTYDFTEFYLSAEKYGSDEVSGHSDEGFSLGVLVLAKEDFREYAEKVGVKGSETDHAVILVDEYTEYGEKTRIYRLTNLSAGDTVSGELETLENGDFKNVPMDLKVTKVTNTHPIGYESLYGGNRGFLVVSEEDFSDYIFPEQSGAFIEAKDADAAVTEICELMLTDELDGLQFYVFNLQEEASQMKRMLLTVSIFLYGFVIVIVLIGVTNIVNTISTDMRFRAKEFAMLKSVGMSRKEFNRMIRLESLMYGTKSLVIGLPLGLLIAVALNKAFAEVLEVAFKFPLTAMGISILCVAAIVGFTMHLSVAKINRQNIIETIRKQTL